MTSDMDPYRTLGVDHAAEPEVVAAAYRALARAHHPDVSRREDAERRMAEINAAWATLRDPVRRAAYDREHGIVNGVREDRGENPLRGMQRKATTAATSSPEKQGSPAAASHRGSSAARPGEVRWRRGPDGEGAAGPPPGRPRGSVLPFGRHIGWSLVEIARADPGYLQWLAPRPEGAKYRAEIEAILAPLLRGTDVRVLGDDAAAPARSRRRFGR